MYKRALLQIIPFCIGLVCLLATDCKAQERRPFTGSNYITIVLEGQKGRYEFRSSDLLVRYNKTTEQLECSVLISSLQPASDTIPPNMAYEVLYGSKFPEINFLINVPKEVINDGKPYPEPLRQLTSITLQGITNESRIPVVFAPDRNRLTFGTSFDLMLDNFEASVPVKYLTVLTGRLLININNAQWVEP